MHKCNWINECIKRWFRKKGDGNNLFAFLISLTSLSRKARRPSPFWMNSFIISSLRCMARNHAGYNGSCYNARAGHWSPSSVYSAQQIPRLHSCFPIYAPRILCSFLSPFASSQCTVHTHFRFSVHLSQPLQCTSHPVLQLPVILRWRKLPNFRRRPLMLNKYWRSNYPPVETASPPVPPLRILWKIYLSIIFSLSRFTKALSGGYCRWAQRVALVV